MTKSKGHTLVSIMIKYITRGVAQETYKIQNNSSRGGKQSTKINHPCISAHKAILMNGLKDGNGVMTAHFSSQECESIFNSMLQIRFALLH